MGEELEDDAAGGARRRLRPHPVVVVGAAFLAGSVPFAQLVARRRARVDLRRVGTGTVSGSGLYHVAGLGPLLVAGVLDVAKGTVGPLLAGPERPALAAAAAGAGVCGHNWSPFLRGSGGRGVSVALGALTVAAPEGAALVLGSLAVGRLADDNPGIGTLAGGVALVPLLARTRGRRGTALALAVVTPMLLKRLAGNRRATAPATYLRRLVLDRDTADEADYLAPVGDGGRS